MRCPICYQAVSPGCCEVCEHWFGTNEGCDFLWWDTFPNEEVHELESIVEHIDVIDRPVPAYLEPILRSIYKRDESLWADNRTEKIRWESDGMASGAGYHWFHPNPHYASRLSNKFERAIRWLKKNMKDQLQDFE